MALDDIIYKVEIHATKINETIWVTVKTAGSNSVVEWKDWP